MSTSQKMGLEERLMDFILKGVIILMFVMILFVGVFLADTLTIQETGIKKVDCFDEYKNKIIGLKCEDKSYCTLLGFVNGQKCSEVKT